MRACTPVLASWTWCPLWRSIRGRRTRQPRCATKRPPGWPSTFDVPVFLYGRLRDGTSRTLPEVRRHAFKSLAPDMGPMKPSAERGASAIGARPVLVAWNLWIRGVDLAEGRMVAKALRRPEVRALAFQMPDMVQISFNLIDPAKVRPSVVYDKAASSAGRGRDRSRRTGGSGSRMRSCAQKIRRAGGNWDSRKARRSSRGSS